MVNHGNCFSFGAGIEYALEKLSFPGNTRATFASDAQIIQNAFINVISRYDPMFRAAFGGLSLAGSYLDNIKINLPEEFDMHVKIVLDCDLEPIGVPDHPGFVFIAASDGSSHCVCKFRKEGFFVNRLSVQTWFRDNISHVMPELQKIRCEEGRVYRLDYTAHGYGVAHTMVAQLVRCAQQVSWAAGGGARSQIIHTLRSALGAPGNAQEAEPQRFAAPDEGTAQCQRNARFGQLLPEERLLEQCGQQTGHLESGTRTHSNTCKSDVLSPMI